MEESWAPPDLAGQVAVVTGSSRGVGRGVAEVLGECGATVYVCARNGVEAVAEEVDRLGGSGVAVRCDFSSPEQVEELFERVRKEQSRLDVLVNNVIGWDQEQQTTLKQMVAPLWWRPVENWDGNFHVGLRSHFLACRFGLHLMLPARRGLVVFTTERPADEPNRDLSIDVRTHAAARFVFSLARQLDGRGITALGLYPGFPRTEGILESFEARHGYFEGWTQESFMQQTESVHYTGRAIATLAAAPDLEQRAGRVVGVYELAREYGFTDVDGRQPLPVGMSDA